MKKTIHRMLILITALMMVLTLCSCKLITAQNISGSGVSGWNNGGSLSGRAADPGTFP